MALDKETAKLLIDRDARQIYSATILRFTADDVERYRDTLVAYANEVSSYRQLVKQTDICDYRQQVMLSMVMGRMMKLAASLRLTPKSSSRKAADEPMPVVECPPT